MTAPDVECVVIGAGVIGLAAARALALSGREVVVLEAATMIGSETSSRNSEVIHAGLYYPADSLKARFCAPGREMLYAYCDARGVDYRRLGKLVVAHDESELPALKAIQERAVKNGVADLEFVDEKRLCEMEPALRGHAALWSPSTGILDTHSFMHALQGDAEDNGAVCAFGAPVVAGSVEDGYVILEIGGAEPIRISARIVVNAAGLAAAHVAGKIEGLAKPPPAIGFAKGNYFGMSGKAPFTHLIYPVPEPGGLGVHLTLDLAGRARFGPDVEWIDAIDYSVDASRAEPFYAAIRRYWPELPDDSLHPDYCGIRTKVDGQATSDFVIDNATGTVINLYGIESPGLTSSLAIAEEVERRVDAHQR